MKNEYRLGAGKGKLYIDGKYLCDIDGVTIGKELDIRKEKEQFTQMVNNTIEKLVSEFNEYNESFIKYAEFFIDYGIALLDKEGNIRSFEDVRDDVIKEIEIFRKLVEINESDIS